MFLKSKLKKFFVAFLCASSAALLSGCTTAKDSRPQAEKKTTGLNINNALDLSSLLQPLPKMTEDPQTDKFDARNRTQDEPGLIWPVFGRFTSPFGLRRLKRKGKVRMHEGIDIAAPVGTPIRASEKGRVVFVGSQKGYGHSISILSANRKGFKTFYAHMGKLVVHAGQWVEQNQIIGYVGRTGRETGPHLHYEVNVDGVHKNPLAYLPPSRFGALKKGQFTPSLAEQIAYYRHSGNYAYVQADETAKSINN